VHDKLNGQWLNTTLSNSTCRKTKFPNLLTTVLQAAASVLARYIHPCSSHTASRSALLVHYSSRWLQLVLLHDRRPPSLGRQPCLLLLMVHLPSWCCLLLPPGCFPALLLRCLA